ncbi:hypothetical protein V8E53_010662 [Lactarius tabidus]
MDMQLTDPQRSHANVQALLSNQIGPLTMISLTMIVPIRGVLRRVAFKLVHRLGTLSYRTTASKALPDCRALFERMLWLHMLIKITLPLIVWTLL